MTLEIDKDKFNFIRAEGTLYRKALLKVQSVIQDLLENKPYTIDWEEVFCDYEEKGGRWMGRMIGFFVIFGESLTGLGQYHLFTQ